MCAHLAHTLTHTHSHTVPHCICPPPPSPTARIFRSSPQFGFTLLTYELLQRVFAVDFGKR